MDRPPVLSTPDDHIFEPPASVTKAPAKPRLTDEDLAEIYEVDRTIKELDAGGWKRIALQFPDHMLVDSPRVFNALANGLKILPKDRQKQTQAHASQNLDDSSINHDRKDKKSESDYEFCILADTSYGACCVDEVAAEHADAQIIVHYGRSCLSPTSRLPVIYVFTKAPLNLEPVIDAFKLTYCNFDEEVILMADVPYIGYLQELQNRLISLGYNNAFKTDIQHNASSLIPNRTIPKEIVHDAVLLKNYRLFHISDPPPAVLLTLSSRVADIHIFPTTSNSDPSPRALAVSSAATLRRRYATILKLSTVPIFGILVNTLSVANYMHVISHVKQQIAEAGKKSYTFIVGKINSAKVANFSEVGGWVVIGCWESSLFDSSDFWKPVITPFELEIALKRDSERVWTGQWSSDFNSLLDKAQVAGQKSLPSESAPTSAVDNAAETAARQHENGYDCEEESEPPEFDLRTGRYVSSTRPMPSRRTGVGHQSSNSSNQDSETSLIKRTKGDLATIGGEVSPAADFFRNKRSWQGLGSDFEITYDEDGVMKPQEAAVIEQGRAGIARGYRVGEGSRT